MKATSLILALVLFAPSAQAFSGVAGPQGGHGDHSRLARAIGRLGFTTLVPEVAPPDEAARPPFVDLPYAEPPQPGAPGYAPAYAPTYIPAARPRRPGPHIIYLRKPRDVAVPDIVYGAD